MIISESRWTWTPTSLLDQFIKDVDFGGRPKVDDIWIKADIYDALMREMEDRFKGMLVKDPTYARNAVPSVYGVRLHQEPK